MQLKDFGRSQFHKYRINKEALYNNYMFLSYGDSMVIV